MNRARVKLKNRPADLLRLKVQVWVDHRSSLALFARTTGIGKRKRPGVQ
jgi:hypothetical protein